MHSSSPRRDLLCTARNLPPSIALTEVSFAVGMEGVVALRAVRRRELYALLKLRELLVRALGLQPEAPLEGHLQLRLYFGHERDEVLQVVHLIQASRFKFILMQFNR